MGVGMCLYAQLVQTKNKQCRSAIILQYITMLSSVFICNITNPRLQIIRERYDLRYYYFTNRIVNMWNSLSSYIVSAESVNCFKNQIDNLWKDQQMIFKEPETAVKLQFDSFSPNFLLLCQSCK